MQLDELIAHLARLKGMWLQPLGKARPIRLVEIDLKRKRVVLEVDSNRKRVTRSFAELEKVLAALNQRSAIHVDSVLAGSGSSRSQPETLLAHLPSIEFLWVNGKKHLARVSEPTRAYGTVKEMDPIRALDVVADLGLAEARPAVSALIVTDDYRGVAKSLGAALGLAPRSVSELVISLGSGTSQFWIAHPQIGVESGTYAVIDSGGGPDLDELELGGVVYARILVAGTVLFARRR